MSLFHTIRLVIFAISLVFALILLGLNGHYLSVVNQLTNGTIWLIFNALGVAVSVITLITILPILIIDRARKGAFTSLVWFELVWTGILWVLWIAAAAESAGSIPFTSSCVAPRGFVGAAFYESACHQYQAIQAFSWLAWLLMFGYFITLLTLAVIQHASKGNTRIWFSSVPDSDFFAPAQPSAMQPQQQAFAPQQQPMAAQHGQYGAPSTAQYQQPQYAGSPQPQYAGNQYPTSPAGTVAYPQGAYPAQQQPGQQYGFAGNAEV
ncbi:hypothetical protein BOTBODRAFT_555195 [Botryobasidium botryosum FD-172 SS1]|uniref:MARVEL domain-containing protein n=1 Tax=Botryobasidium botryosum (strain FD-172 SS1) TaxID=930990 RepID=A0A067MB86_BOTB1|nr:hypothetical protein BOTBODRAFT_555195 [Botryobasidium botryosum FD-172 SS1]